MHVMINKQMSSSGLVSIITPSWNCGQLLEDTIQSIQAQTYTNWELLFQDDCSTDDTKERVHRLMVGDARIKYACNPCNSGAAITRNNALMRARGRWIAFLDSDDLWLPDKLEKQIAFMEENHYSFSYTEYVEMDAAGKEMGILISGPKHISRRGMYNFCWPGCLTVMYDAEKVGLIQIADIKKNNDYAMWLKVCHKADCHLLSEPLAKYRKGRLDSISSHGYLTLMKWHYKLFHEANGNNVWHSLWLTAWNMVFGVYKKLAYRKKYIV